MSWAIGSVLSRKWQMKVDPFTATGMGDDLRRRRQLHRRRGDRPAPPHRADPRALISVLYLVVFGSWVGYSAYIWLLKHVPTPKVATYAYVNPLVAVFLGWLVLHERFDGYMFAGTVVIVAGVALVTTAKIHGGVPSQEPGSGLPELESEV